jgi:hypothetical protein
MRDYEGIPFVLFVLRRWRVAFKDKLSTEVDAAASPPQPLPKEEGVRANLELCSRRRKQESTSFALRYRAQFVRRATGAAL